MADAVLISCANTAVLSRVQAFLPEIAASNAQLELQARQNPQSIDIESVREGEAYIKMVRPALFFGHSKYPKRACHT